MRNTNRRDAMFKASLSFSQAAWMSALATYQFGNGSPMAWVAVFGAAVWCVVGTVQTCSTITKLVLK